MTLDEADDVFVQDFGFGVFNFGFGVLGLGSEVLGCGFSSPPWDDVGANAVYRADVSWNASSEQSLCVCSDERRPALEGGEQAEDSPA